MNNTLHNGFRILDHLAATAAPLSVKELSEHFGLPNSHICRLLKSLVETGYVEQDPRSRKYCVSLKILNLAHARLKEERLLGLARPYLRNLVQQLDAVVYVTRYYAGHSLIIGAEYPALFPVSGETVIGALHSPTSTACGQICAAYSLDCELENLLAQIDWSAPGDFQNRRDDFERELEMIRRRGYSVRNTSGRVKAVGVPLFENEIRFTGALGVMLSPEYEQNSEQFEKVVEAALNCGKLVSFAQGAPSEGYPHYITSFQGGKK